MPSATSRMEGTAHMSTGCIYKFRLGRDASGAYMSELVDD